MIEPHFRNFRNGCQHTETGYDHFGASVWTGHHQEETASRDGRKGENINQVGKLFTDIRNYKSYLSFSSEILYIFFLINRYVVHDFRLSSIAGSKLTHNNPNIADLSDKNRPQKIGEMFNELYDNEWTDTVDSMTETMEETEVITKLRKALQYVYTKTKREAEDQYRSLQNALFQVQTFTVKLKWKSYIVMANVSHNPPLFPSCSLWY